MRGRPAVRNGKAVAMPVGQLQGKVVCLAAIERCGVRPDMQERNYGFNTAVGTAQTAGKNTISACVHANQTITDGQSVRLRLLEAMRVADKVIRETRSWWVRQRCRVNGKRELSSIEYGGTIIPVELSVFDSDGQEGIFIPRSSMEMDAVRR